jgi:cation diffusion facilitator family transporter
MPKISQENNFYSPDIATRVSSATAFVLMIMKVFVGFFSGSISVLASALDSFFDVIVSLFNNFTYRKSIEPSDNEHKFGHGKFEAFAQFIQGSIIGISGLFLFWYGAKKIINPVIIEHEKITLLVMIFSIIITFVLFLYLKKAGKKQRSLIIETDKEHYYIDILTNGAVILSLILNIFFEIFWADGAVSVLIAFFIIKSSFDLLQESFKILTDHKISSKDEEIITNILNRNKQINGWHELRTRYSGSTIFADVHLEFTPETSLEKVHNISCTITSEIRNKLPNIEILTHFDIEKD